MKDLPLLFTQSMMLANLGNRKWKTRRTRGLEAINVTPGLWELKPGDCYGPVWMFASTYSALRMQVKCPYGVVTPGRTMWAREQWAVSPTLNHVKPIELEPGTRVFYKASYPNGTHLMWRQSLHMPRWASRFERELVSIRIEPLREITGADAIAEGVELVESRSSAWAYQIPGDPTGAIYDTAIEAYRALWETINGEGSWALNPWVWVIEYQRGE